MTHEEKVEMYNRLTKAQIIEMLIESNRVIDFMLTGVIYNPAPSIAPDPLEGWKVTCNLATEKDYYMLRDSGMLWEFYPELTGNWEEDKKVILK